MADVELLAGSAFPDGTKVQAVRRTGDFFAAGSGDVVASTRSDGVTVSFKDLPAGPYWAVGEDGRAVAFTSKTVEPSSKKYTPPNHSHDPSRSGGVAKPGRVIITGPRGTKVGDRLVEAPLPSHVSHASPHLNQASIGPSVPQRSATPLGEATPTDPAEPLPRPRQDQVKANVKQRSSTELGEATPIVDEAGPTEQPSRKAQRSSTPEGEQTPVGSAEPRGTASNPDSRDQAAGVRRTDTRKAATKKGVKAAAGASKVKKKK